MSKYTVEDYLNEMDLTEAEDDDEEEDEETEDVEEGLDQELTEGLQVIEENLTILLTEAKKKGVVGKAWKSFTKRAKGVGATISGAAASAKKSVTGAGKSVAGAGKSALAKTGMAKTTGKGKKKKFGLTTRGKVTAGGVGLAAALGGGALAYRKFFGKAAKACADKKGAEKAACMKKFRAGATEAAIMALQDNSSHCDNSKAPEKCYARVNEAIEQLRTNLDVLREG